MTPPKTMRLLVVESDLDQRLEFLGLVESYCARSGCSWTSTTLPVDDTSDPIDPSTDHIFEITFARLGEEAIAKVCDAVADDRPYEVAFVRLGDHNGVEFSNSLNSLWRIDGDLQAVALAPAEQSDWPGTAKRLIENDRLYLLNMPVHAEELCQIAISLSAKRSGVMASQREIRELGARNRDLQAELGTCKFSEHQLAHAAVHDGLTGLPNREYIRELIAEFAQEAKPNSTALMFLDVDDFKSVNDRLGHRIGDELLVEFSQRIKEIPKYRQGAGATQSTYVARLGGDEFVLLATGLNSNQEAEEIALALQQHVTAPYKLGQHAVNIGVSIGITFLGEGIKAADQLMHNADLAMYRAKFGGKQCVAVYDDAMHRVATRRLYLETALRSAQINNELSLMHQPMYRLSDGKLMVLETLLRWTLEDGTSVSPDEFIPIAEDTGLITPIGDWVIVETCKAISELNRNAEQPQDYIGASVNVAKRQLATVGFASRVKEILEEFGIDGRELCIEVTEETILDASGTINENIAQLRAMNVRLFLDDFGTGHSSLNCLHKLPIDVVKIDRSFVSTMEANGDYECIVSAIVTLAHSFGTTVVAEGVESELHVEQLEVLGCDWGQGYLYSKPLATSALEKLVADAGQSVDAAPIALDIDCGHPAGSEQSSTGD